MTKRQICFTCSQKLYEKMLEESRKSGLPLSKIIELKLNGYKIEKVN